MQPFTTTPPWSRRWLPVVVVPLFLAFWLPRSSGFGWFPAIVLPFILIGLVSALASRLEVDVSGTLRVRGLLPGRERTLDLSQLTSARATEYSTNTRTSGSHNRHMTIHQVFELRDAAGRELRVEPHAWRRADLVVDAVEHAARARGVAVEGAEMFGMERAEAPPGPRPAVAGAETALPRPPVVPATVLTVKPRASIRATAVWFAVIGSVLGLVVFGMGSLIVGLLLSWAGLEGVPIVLPAVLAWLAALVFVVSSAIGARLTLTPEGVLTVKSWPPWPRRLRLTELERLQAGTGPWVYVGTLDERTTRVTLTERSGGRVKLMAEAWNDLPVLMPALAAWADRAGAQYDERTRDYLLLGRKPGPVGARPGRQR